jgi:hypothetical protein
MKVTLKDSTRVVYEKRTSQIIVDIDGQEYIIRNSEDDNGVEYFIFNENFEKGWTNPHELEDGELKDVLQKLAETCYDDFIFSERKVGKEVDLEELQDY